VGALAVARFCESLGAPFALGGVAWERFAIDPHPGPRAAAEIRGAAALGSAAVVAGPQTTTPEGVSFAEAGVARHLGQSVALIDVTGGARGAAKGVAAALERLDCDLLLGVDVGGDVLARGSEKGLASPLCDAVMVAACIEAAGGADPLLAVIGPGCDGELAAADVLDRVAALGRAGAWLGTWGVTPQAAAEIQEVAQIVPTEASVQVARCALGETGPTPIRGGRTQVELGPVGALSFFFDAARAAAELPLVDAVAGTESIEDARAALASLGVRTELDYERARAAEAT
jgi:hypothetical protein